MTRALLCAVLAACGSSGGSPGSPGSDGSAGPSADGSSGDGPAPILDATEVGAPAEGGSTDASSVQDAAATDAVATDGLAPGDAGAAEGGAMPDGDVLMPVYVTFYGWEDNSPPGGAIAYPKGGGYPTRHETAGGTGTYGDPITFATDMAEFGVGTVLYVPFIEKYVVMEDDCVQCDSDWTSSHKFHIDVWMNSNGSEDPAALNRCEDQWTRATTNVEVSPPPTRPVTAPPLFDPMSNVCRSTP
ncbi:MAG TPA: hypothetical protein VKU41_15580 [Polyangiaceae bacterium]|nr:hypothetical protein [Polyangiaceae bacterium]